MGAGIRTRVPNEGPIAESSTLLNLLNFVEAGLDACPDRVSIASQAEAVRESDGGDFPLAKKVEKTQFPKSPALEGSTPEGTNEVASIPELVLGPSSLYHEFPCSLQTIESKPSKADVQLSVRTSPGPSPIPPQKWYLHRAPSGKLTAIPPSPLCQDVTEHLLEDAGRSPGHGVVYAGYRVFNEDPRKYLGFVSAPDVDEPLSQENVDTEKKEDDTITTVETPLHTPSSFPFESDDESGYSSFSESSTGTLSMRRPFASAPKSVGPEPTAIKEDGIRRLSNDRSPEAIKPTRAQNVPDESGQVFRADGTQLLSNHPKKTRDENVLDGYGQFFSLPPRQEVELAKQPANRPVPSDFHDRARIQFRNRRGPWWDLVNKDLEKLFLHAANLTESEFVEFVSCDKDEAQTWLKVHGPRLCRRSLERWMRAHNALENAGIQPNNIKENVLDVFEWMSEEEQANFIKAYQSLYAIVKASEEGLHLTRSEMSHFSRLTNTQKTEFIEEYKNRREERETIVRRDTARFTARLRRSQHDQDQQHRTGLIHEGGKVDGYPTPTKADNFDVKFLYFGMGQEKSEFTPLTATYVPTPSSVSQVKQNTKNKVESTPEQNTGRHSTIFSRSEDAQSELETTPEQQTRRHTTAFTGDGRAGYRKVGAVTGPHETAKTTQVSEETEDSTKFWDRYSGSKECFINTCELLPSDSGEATENGPKETAKIKSHADALKQQVKSNNVESKKLNNNCFQDCGRLATSLLREVTRDEDTNKTAEPVEVEEKAMVETLPSKPVVERALEKEWPAYHPGARLPYPSPPATILSAKGVISSVTSEHLLVADKLLKDLCMEDITPVADKTLILPATKSEPSTPYHSTTPSIKPQSISYVTPPRPSHPSIRGLPSAYRCVLAADLKQDAQSKQSPGTPKSLRKKVSKLFGSLRSKRSRDALRDLKYY